MWSWRTAEDPLRELRCVLVLEGLRRHRHRTPHALPAAADLGGQIATGVGALRVLRRDLGKPRPDDAPVGGNVQLG